MPAQGRTDELASCRFSIDIGGLLVGIFQECSGLNGVVEVESYSEGGLNDYEHKLPGRTKYGNVTLKGGVATSIDLWDWFQEVSSGTFERREISVIMMAANFEEVMRWNLKGAYPVRWEGPSFSAGDTNTSVHSIESAHNGLELIKQ